MKTQWNSLFHKEESNLPSHRFANIMSTGVSVFDGLILVWKLYNKYGNNHRKVKVWGKVTYSNFLKMKRDRKLSE